jgi:hypothetical protein
VFCKKSLQLGNDRFIAAFSFCPSVTDCGDKKSYRFLSVFIPAFRACEGLAKEIPKRGLL